jgi:hypothetical protein
MRPVGMPRREVPDLAKIDRGMWATVLAPRNRRVPHHAWEDLQRAAHILGARPSQLVRMLVLNGARRVLAEHDAAIAAATSP